MTTVRHCQEPVPERLRGDLKPSACMLEVGSTGTHDGPHKAHLTIRRVGKVTFRWKGRAREDAARVVRPEIVLPVAAINAATRSIAKAFRNVKVPKCSCPDWKAGTGRHGGGCRLTSG